MDNLGRSILQFLLEYQGFSHTLDDLTRRLEGQVDAAQVKAAVEELELLGFIYTIEGYIYTTQKATVRNLNAVQPAAAYDRLRQKYQNSADLDSTDKLDTFMKAIVKNYNHFKLNHLEYERFYVWLENSETNWREFVKEVLRTFTHQKLLQENKETFSGEPQYQAGPEVATIEHAIAEVILRFSKYVPAYSHLFDDRKKLKEAYDMLSYDFDGFIEQILESLKLSPGIFIGDSVLFDVIKAVLRKKADLSPFDKLSGFLSGFSVKIKRAISQKYGAPVIFNDSDFDTVAPALRALDNLSACVDSYRSKAGNQKICNRTLTEFLSKLISYSNFSGRDLHKINLSEIDIVGSIFLGANLVGSSWSQATVTNCNFNMADLSDSLFEVKKMSMCSIDKTNFSNAVTQLRNIDWSTITGKPINLTQREVAANPESLDTIVNTEVSLNSKALPIEKDDYFDATTIALALQKFLNDQLTIESSKLKFQLVKTSMLPESQIKQLRDWLEGGEVPQFDYGDNLLRWLVQQNKSKELQDAGFNSKEINSLFGKSRSLEPGGEKVTPMQSLQEQRRDKIQQFLHAVKGMEDIPIKELQNLIFVKSPSVLTEWLSNYGKTMSVLEAYSLYVNLVSTIKGFHIHADYRGKLKRPYEGFPHNTYFSNLKHTRYNVAGAGKQFGIILTPDSAAIPPKLRQLISYTIEHGTSHLAGAICFARIAPYTVIERDDSGRNYSKYIWYITEMQADDYQKLGSVEMSQVKALISKFGENAVRDYRRFFRQWPETLLNIVVKAAKLHNVTEVWMPEHVEVEAKTFSGRTSESDPGSVPNWYNAYDRPAKVFNSSLENIGANLTLDPGSVYDRTSNQAYVIKVNAPERISFLFNYGREFQKLAALEDYDWNMLFERGLKHHINWIINENRPKFPEVEQYITDEMIAQFGWGTFFKEYNISQEILRDVEALSELKRLFTEELGYRLYDPPFIDWLHWMQKAWEDVRFYLQNQRKITPDLNVTDEEMARDWLKLWEEEQVPADIMLASWYRSKFLATIQLIFADKNLGDVLSTNYVLPPSKVNLDLLFNPVDKNEGEKDLVDSDGNIIPESEWEDMDDKVYNIDSGDVEVEVDRENLLNDLLDQLSVALDEGDDNLVQQLKTSIERLTANSSLGKLAWSMSPANPAAHSDFSYEYWKDKKMPKNLRLDTRKGFLLRYLAAHPGIRYTELVERNVLYNTGRSRALQELKQLGLIISDKRKYSLSDYGASVVEQIKPGSTHVDLLTFDDPEITQYLRIPPVDNKLSWQIFDDNRREVDEAGNVWYYNSKNELHRLDGPAIEWADGTKWWYQHDRWHRLDGPANEWVNGFKRWFIDGEEIGDSTDGFTDEDFENYKRDHSITASRVSWQADRPVVYLVDFNGAGETHQFYNKEGSLIFGGLDEGHSSKKTAQISSFYQAEKGAQEGFNEEAPQDSSKTSLDILYPTLEDIIDVHDDVIVEHGGLLGISEDGRRRIEAALGRMQAGFGPVEFYPSLAEKAAVLMHSLITTHPFIDGNKRTAFMASLEFLEDNGLTLFEAEHLADIIINVANNTSSYEHLLEWIQENHAKIEGLDEREAFLFNEVSVDRERKFYS